MPSERQSFTLPVEPISPPPKHVYQVNLPKAHALVEAPGTAPGSEKLHFDAVYRHSRHKDGMINIGERAPIRKMSPENASMDQQTNAGLNRVRLGFPGGPELPALALSVAAILGLAALFAGLVAAAVLFGQFVVLGERGLRGFYLGTCGFAPAPAGIIALR